MGGKASWTSSKVKILDDGDLEMSGGLIVENPLMKIELPDVNSSEFKGELFQRIWREGLHNRRDPKRIRALFINSLGLTVNVILQALEE